MVRKKEKEPELLFELEMPGIRSPYTVIAKRSELEKIVTQVVGEMGFTTLRERPSKVEVKVYRAEPVRGTMTRWPEEIIEVTPPFVALDSNSYNDELQKLLVGLPPEFQEYVSSEAWDRGHSSGYEECLSVAYGLAYDLRNVLDKYTKRILQGK